MTVPIAGIIGFVLGAGIMYITLKEQIHSCQLLLNKLLGMMEDITDNISQNK